MHKFMFKIAHKNVLSTKPDNGIRENKEAWRISRNMKKAVKPTFIDFENRFDYSILL